jgi:hypothetical protein
MKIVAVILALLGCLLVVTGLSLLGDYMGYDSTIQAEVVQVDGREPVYQLPASDTMGRPLRLRYGQISGTGIDRIADGQAVPNVGDKLELIQQPNKPHTARLRDSLSYSVVFWTATLGLLLAASGVGLFVYAWKRPKPAAKTAGQIKRSQPQRIPI